MAVSVQWAVPSGLTPNFSKTIIFRSQQEQLGYEKLAAIDTFNTDGSPNTIFLDVTGTNNNYYVIRFFDNNVEFNDFTLGFHSLSPREKRLILYIKSWIPEILKPDLTDFDIAFSLRLAINDFVIHPPETPEFADIDSFPATYEQFLIVGTQVKLAQLKYLKLGIRDFSYSDMGFSLNVQRGEKIAKAIEDLNRQWINTIDKAKWNFISQGLGLGTIPLPISIGGSISRGVLNVLDLFTAMGR